MTDMGDDSQDQRLMALEIRLAHFERMVEDLSDVIVDQGRAMDLMTAQIRRMRERIVEVAAGAEGSPQDDRPPPHY
jgi:SlyX protein